MYWRQRGPFRAGGETENGLRRRNLHHQGIVGAFARSSRDNLPSPAAVDEEFGAATPGMRIFGSMLPSCAYGETATLYSPSLSPTTVIVYAPFGGLNSCMG